MKGWSFAALLLAASMALAGCGAVYLPAPGASGAAGGTVGAGGVPATGGAASGSGRAGGLSSAGGAAASGGASGSGAVSSGPLSPTSSSSSQGAPIASPQRVTLADNGKTVTMHVGETFLLALGDQQQWSVEVANQSVLARVPNIMVVRGAQGVYKALAAGTTTLSATGTADCSAGQMCPMYAATFRVTVQVLAG